MKFEGSQTTLQIITISGQTWAMTIIHFILHSKELEEGKDISFDDFFSTMPFMESEFADGTMGADQFRSLEPPRYMKTHLPFPLWKKQLEKHPDLKVIQTLRNPKDTLVSYYHHMINDGHMGVSVVHGTNILKSSREKATLG